jgi:hypothetical protein
MSVTRRPGAAVLIWRLEVRDWRPVLSSVEGLETIFPL